MAKKHFKRCSTSLVWDMQIKSIMRYTSFRMSKNFKKTMSSADKDGEPPESSYTGRMNEKWLYTVKNILAVA